MTAFGLKMLLLIFVINIQLESRNCSPFVSMINRGYYYSVG